MAFWKAKKEAREKHDRLRFFRDLLRKNEQLWRAEVDKMDEREQIYEGNVPVYACAEGDEEIEKARHVRNLCMELVEAQIDNGIPYPKVTAVHKEDEERAKRIEEYLRAVLDFLPFEQINDMAERTAKIQGGTLYLVEYDAERDESGLFPISVKNIHPKWIVPQYGVFDSIESMDYIFLKLPCSKSLIKRKYGADLSDLSEEEPEIKTHRDYDASDELVTLYHCYYRNEEGGIGLFSFAGDTVLCDMTDYQARKVRRCPACGRIGKAGETGCPCSEGKFVLSDLEGEELADDIETERGTIPAYHVEKVRERDEASGLEWTRESLIQTVLPFYKPNRYPLILQKNVSVFGSLLGESDIDRVSDQQNTTNRLYNLILDRLIKGGTYVSLPALAEIEEDSRIGKVIRLDNPGDRSAIGTYDMTFDVSSIFRQLEQVYQEARQAVGVTDSYQGRKDATATSGTAKQIAASQAAERIESKKIMKHAAYASLYEMIFKLSLAYFDEPRDITVRGERGERRSAVFSRYDFLTEDGEGGWRYNDAFLFSVDSTSALASNREAMWQEASRNFASGAFGNPAELDTMILYWKMMDELHYPMAGTVKSELEERKKRQMQAEQEAALPAVPPPGTEESPLPVTAERLPLVPTGEREEEAITRTEEGAEAGLPIYGLPPEDDNLTKERRMRQ